MKKYLILLGISIILILSSSIAFSATVTIQYIKPLDNITKDVYMQGLTSGKVYAGLYSFKVNGKDWDSYCIDPFNFIGNTWTAFFYTPGDIASGLNGKLFSHPVGNPGLAREKYRMLGYLYGKYGRTLATADERANLSLAFWEIAKDFDGSLASLDIDNGAGGFYLKSGSYGNAENWLSEAFGYKDNGPLPYIYTPNPLTASQEIFAIPEPGSLLLIGSGLLGLGVFSRYRRRKRD